MIKIIKKGACILAAVLLAGGIQTPVRAQGEASTQTEKTGVTITTREAFMNALAQKRSPITVAAAISIGKDADASGRMRPVIIPADTVICGTPNGSICSRSPIQLEGDDVVFRDIKLTFESTDALGSVPHREIFLAGHSLVMDNVDTYLEGGADIGGFGGTEEELLPTVFAGGYPETKVADHASLTVMNSNAGTMFEAICMGHGMESDNKTPYQGKAVLELDARAVVRDGVYTSQNSQAEISITGTENQSAKTKRFYGNEHTVLTLTGVSVENMGDGNAETENIGSIVLENKAHLAPATEILHNVTLKSGACLDFNGAGNAVIAGNFSGEEDPAKDRGILVLNTEGSLEILGTVTGTTQFQTYHRLFPGTLLRDKTYIYAENGGGTDSGFVLNQSYVDNGFGLQYDQKKWTVSGLTDDREVGGIEIRSAPTSVNLGKISANGSETIPDETIYFEIVWYDNSGEEFSHSDVMSDYYLLYDLNYVIKVKTDYWESDDPAILEKEDWFQNVWLMAAEDHPGKYFLQAYDGAAPGDYTFLFCSDSFEGNLATVADVKALKDTVKAECRVSFYNEDSAVIPDHTHYYQESIISEADCMRTGAAKYICDCGNMYTKKIPALGHQPVIDPAVEPTETMEGKTEGYHCDRCNEVLLPQEIIPATGKPEEHIHNYKGNVTKEPLCAESGIMTYICSCGDQYAEEIAAMGHQPVIDAAVPPTETMPGKTEGSHCKICGEILKAQETIPATGKPENPDNPDNPDSPATPDNPGPSGGLNPPSVHGHSYQSVVTRRSTCTQAGIRTYTCSCGASYTEKLPLADHQYVRECIPATPNSSGKRQQVCRVCGHAAEVTVIDSPQELLLAKDSYSCDGKVKKPAVTVKDSKGKALADGTDYRVSYSKGRKNPGVYTVTVEFQGNYSGRMTSSFTIKPKKTSLKKVTAKSKGIQVTWKKQTAQIGGYQIQYGTSKNFTGKTVKLSTAKKNTITKKISKLKGKKKYYVRIRTYKTVKVNGKSRKLYSDWSAKKAVVTKK